MKTKLEKLTRCVITNPFNKDLLYSIACAILELIASIVRILTFTAVYPRWYYDFVFWYHKRKMKKKYNFDSD